MEQPCVLFVSAAPQSVGHVYRVTNHAERLRDQGFRVLVVEPALAVTAMAALPGLQAVVLFRPSPASDQLDQWRALCSQRKLRLLCDVDDLTFVPDLLDQGGWPYWNQLPDANQQQWRQRFAAQRAALLASDGVLVSTAALAKPVQQLKLPAWVWPNGFGDLSWAIARHVRRQPRPEREGVLIGYASGTPTHAADFALVDPTLARVLEAYPQVKLRVLGALDLDQHPALHRHRDRIDCQPVVPYALLPQHLAQFSINIAPLQMESRFCQAKSELKFFEAAAVGVPSVVSATEPFESVVVHRQNGCLAATAEEWWESLSWLVNHPSERDHLAKRALRTTRQRFSPRAQARDLNELLKAGVFGVDPRG